MEQEGLALTFPLCLFQAVLASVTRLDSCCRFRECVSGKQMRKRREEQTCLATLFFLQ